jgi:hypothetical protein
MTKDDARHGHGQGENGEEFQIKDMIYEIRGQKVMLDSDLAALYEVETFNLNKAVKRNIERLPSDFMFQLTKDEWENLIFQNGISSFQHGGRRSMPSVFRFSDGLIRKGHGGNTIIYDIRIMTFFLFSS